MAGRNYLVEGLSGAGKSSVYDELVRRGYRAVSTDRAWKHGSEKSTWNEARALAELESPEPDVLFVCGSARNRDRFLSCFTEVFNLRIDDDTMRRRLAERTNNDFGKHPGELELMLGLNRRDEKPAGAIDVDATRPLAEVVDEVLRLAGSPAPPGVLPWSRVAGEAVETCVTRASGEVVTRIAYGWSRDVLATLLSYLEAGGVALGPQLTWDDRARHLPRLDPTAFDPAELRRHYEQRHGTAAPGVDYAMLDGVAFLRDTLEALEPGLTAEIIG